MLPQRADIIVAGALVLSESLRALGVEEGRLEQNDLLLGFLAMRRPDAATE
jgi:exopolyphosphatase/pppGpp-phosphohydrolase